MGNSGFARRARASIIAGAGTVVVCALAATPAGATGGYPGETLSLALQGTSVSGHETQFVASGQDADVADYAGGFSLEVFAKNTSVDPTCSNSYLGEEQASVGDQYEQQIVIGDPEGLDTSFTVPFKYVFPGTGGVTLCAYSTWVTDTAASASLKINVLPAGSGASKPVNTKKPKLTRSGKTLKCSRGSWRNASSYRYGWSVSGHTKKGATSSRFKIAKGVKGSVVCRVTASNAAGKTVASSRALHVH